MNLKSLVALFFIFLSIQMSVSNPESSLSSTSKQVQERHFQGRVVHGHVGAALYARVKDEDHEVVLSYNVKKAHGMGGVGGGGGAAVHHSGKNRASSLSTHSSFVFPCIVAVFGLILFPIF